MLRGHAEVEADRLRVTDVQVAVGLGREARDHAAVTTGREVVADDLTDEVERSIGFGGGHARIPHPENARAAGR